MSIATEISRLMGDDGQRFESADGASLDALCAARRARVQYGRPLHDDGACRAEPVTRSEYRSGDPVRYQFDDGSAIVVAGAAWDLEGTEPFSWAGA